MTGDNAPHRAAPALDEPLPGEQETTNARVAGASGILALGNICSRMLGLAREIVLTFLFGATGAVDALQVAIIVPKAIYDLLIGGHINGAIVPVLSDVITLRGKDELWRVLSALVSLVIAALALLVALIELLAPQIVPLVAPGLDATTRQLAIQLLRLTGPSLLFLSLFAVFSGTLFALRSFTLPAFAGLVFNGCIVLVTLALAPSLAWQPSLAERLEIFPLVLSRPASGIVAVALGWLAGAAAQMLLQMPGLRLRRLRLSFDWRHPALKSIGLLYLPVMFSLSMDTLIIRPFSYRLASMTGDGGIAIMNWATTLVQFPQGLVATAISIAILPTLVRQSTEMTEAAGRAFKDTLGLGLRLAITLILPAAAGLFALAVPIIALLFENGAFLAADTANTALALRLYLLGLPFAAIDLLLVYAFYARKDTLTPALVGILSLLSYMGVALLLFERYGLYSLMVADSVKHLAHASVSGWLLWRRLDGFGAQDLRRTLLKSALASALMAAAAYFTLPAITRLIGPGGILNELLLVFACALIYGGVFVLGARALKLGELAWLLTLLRQRLRGA